MTLPVSGAISFANMNVEMGVASGTQLGMNDARARRLFGVNSGTVTASNAYGKTSQAMVTGFFDNLTNNFTGYNSDPPNTFGTLTPTAIGSHAVIAIMAQKTDAGGAFNDFSVWMQGNSVPQNLFSSITVNGKTYASSVATYSPVVGSYTKWGWATPDPVFTNATSYQAVFAR